MKGTPFSSFQSCGAGRRKKTKHRNATVRKDTIKGKKSEGKRDELTEILTLPHQRLEQRGQLSSKGGRK